MAVYLLHFERPLERTGLPGQGGIGGQQHYCGWSKNHVRRLTEHGTSAGALLTKVAREQGIKWVVADLWVGGTHRDERLLKKVAKKLSFKALCPVCQSC